MAAKFCRLPALARVALSAGVGLSAGAVLSAGVAIAAVQPEPAHAPALTADQVVERNAQARGGLDRWRAIHLMVWTGQMEGASAELPAMQFLLMQARPNRTRFEVNAMGQHSLRVFDGTNGWKAHPGRGGASDGEPFSAEEVSFARDEPAIDPELIDYAAHGSHVSLAGIEQEQGRPAYHLDVVRQSGMHESVWVDAQTFLEVRQDRISYTTAGKPVSVSMFFHDYQDFAGVRIPTRIDIGGADGGPASRMLVEHVDLNGEPDVHAFDLPAPGKRHAGKGSDARRRRASADQLPAWAMRQAGASAGAAPASATGAAPPAAE